MCLSSNSHTAHGLPRRATLGPMDGDPHFDEKAFRLVSQMEAAIVRLDLDSQGQFISLFNAMEMQLESAQPVPAVVDRLAEALLALASARGVDVARLRFAQQLQALRDRVQAAHSRRS